MVAKNYVGLSLLTNALEQVIVLFMFSHTAMGITEMWKPSKMLPQRSNLHDKTPPDVNKPPPTIPLKSLENDYKMISRLGDGGFGIVRLAKYRHDKSNLLQLAKRGTLTDVGDGSNVNLSPLVAIKTMNARLPKLEHYTRVKEVQFIQAMPAHINLLHIYEVFIDTSQYCLHFSMECMDQTLYGLMRSRGGKHFTASTVRSILWQLLSAISHIHDHGYFHRDIKPQNILISSMLQYYGGIDSVPPGSRDQKYMVKLADYGLARHVENCKDFTTYISTRWYRAPEMLLRRKWHSTPVDIWAFGTVAAEVAKVTPLFPGANEIDQIWRIFKVLGNPAPPKNIQARPFPVGGYWVEGQLLAGKCGYSFPEGTGIPIDEFIPHSYPFFFFFFRICLRWNPETRPIASELYDQSYFMYTPEKKAMETSLFKRSGNVSLLSATAKESVDHSNISPIETYDFYKVPPDLEADMDNYGYMDLGNNKENLGPYDIEVDESQIACQSPRTDHTNNLEIDEAMNPLNPNQLKGASSEGTFSFSGSCVSLAQLMG